MTKLNIAILGATSHIAKGLINNILKSGGFNLHLFARSSEKVGDFMTSINQSFGKDCIIHDGFTNFSKYDYDVVINCVGIGTLNKHKGNYSAYFTITEEYDNLVIKYLHNNHLNTLYVSFSSGAIYGKDYSAPVKENTKNTISVNHLDPEDYYSIARLNAEAKHRSFSNLKIVDLRLFSYFSRFIDLTDGYFITELLDCILKNNIFITNDVNITRDFVHPDDLFAMIKKCMASGRINEAFDVMSAKTVEKKEILDYFSNQYKLVYKVEASMKHIGATGLKNIYCSNYNRAERIGYKPVFSSMDTIKLESKNILK